jgi:lipopolysaccharide export system protein LptA
MRITIERLRMWIIVAAMVLVVAIVSFFFYARYRIRQVGRDLPAKLGLEIQTSANGFTVSRSHAGHTQFVLHASKEVQYKSGGKNGGHVILQDVSILLYGKDGSRADQISGSQFDYDQSSGIARADGTVDIEMSAPMRDAAHSTAKTPGEAPSGSRVHVKTSGLTFNQKTQVVTTEQVLTFENGTSSGSARGATYDGENGTLVLAHDVVLHTEVNGDPVTIKAQGAHFNQGLGQLALIKSLTDYRKNHGTADQSTVFFRPDGTAEHLTAEGDVHVITDTGGDLKASDAYLQMNEQGQPQQLRLNGGVLLIVHSANEQNGAQTVHADSDSGTMTFGATDSIEHVQLVQAVSIVDQRIGLPGDEHGSETRELRAAKLDVSFTTAGGGASDGVGRAQAKSLLATGEATVTVHTIHADAPQQSTTLKGDQLFATLIDGHQLSTLRGDGNTYLLQNSPGGVSQTSRGDKLLVTFAAEGSSANHAKATAKQPGGLLGKQSGSQIASAVQEGHVELAELQPSNTPGAPPVKTTATAERVTYDGSTRKLDLSGGTPHIDKEGSDLTAAAVEFDRMTGDASAAGGVKATYAGNAGDSKEPSRPGNSGGAGESMHIVADHASLDHAKDETTFFGVPHVDARLWEGSNSITAPVIVLSRNRQLLTAKGAPNAVKATFVENGSANGGSKARGRQPSVIRITSGSLVYSGGERKATFDDGVTAQGTPGTLHSAELDVYLTPDRAPAMKTPAANKQLGPGGRVDHVVATGHVDLLLGDRRCTGDKLVYTPDDERSVLTGTAGSPPRVTDPVHGTVTGGSLIFNNRDDSVIVSRGQSATVTDTRTPK